MRMLLRLKKDQLKARKEKNQAVSSMLTYLIGQVTRDPKVEATDELIKATIRSNIKALEKSLAAMAQGESYNLIIGDISILEAYLPAKLEGSELVTLVQTAVNSTDSKKMGDVMSKLRELAANIPVEFDGKEASVAIKALLL